MAQWIGLALSAVQSIILVTFFVGQWMGRRETPTPQHESRTRAGDAIDNAELIRTRDRLHKLEGWRQSLVVSLQETFITRREFDRHVQEFDRYKGGHR